MEPNKPRQLFSLRYDGLLEGSAARAFDEALRADPELAESYECFAEVIDLLGALPRPTPDPDFVSRVTRRIHRRQRTRRRARRQPTSLPVLGTLSTLFALLLVAAVGLASHVVDGRLTGLEEVLPATAPEVGTRISARLSCDLPTASALLQTAAAEGLVARHALSDSGARFTVELDEPQLARFLDWLGRQHPLQIGAPGQGAEAEEQVVLQMIILSDGESAYP